MSVCSHKEFNVEADVNRILRDGEHKTSRPVRYNVDLRINCLECGEPFCFFGLPMGLDLNGAAVSVDGQEAHLSIGPSSEALGELDGVSGFGVKFTKAKSAEQEAEKESER